MENVRIKKGKIPEDLLKYFKIRKQNRWILRNDIIWEKPNAMPQSCKDRFSVNYEHIFFFVKSKRYYFEQQFEDYQESSYERARHNVLSEKTDKGIHGGMNLDSQRKAFEKILSDESQGRNKRCVWTIPTQSFSGAHFATFPEKLCEAPIKAGCPKSGIVLDPFAGSGTTLLVAKKLGRRYVGIELNPEYVQMAEKRLAEVKFIEQELI